MASRIIDADDELQNYDEINNNLIASRLLVKSCSAAHVRLGGPQKINRNKRHVRLNF